MSVMDPSELGRRPPIVITEADRARLVEFSDATMQENPNVTRFLREELARADIVPECTTGLVRMGSVVQFVDHQSTRVRRCKLVYPDEAHDKQSISVLTPIGSALLGLGPGQSISWTDAGREFRLTVLDVSQP